MDDDRLVSITISVSKSCRDRLRRIVAETNLKNPDQLTSLSELGRKILCGSLKNWEEKEEEE